MVNDPSLPRVEEHDHERIGRVTRLFSKKIIRYSTECTIDKKRQHPTTDNVRDTCSYELAGDGKWGNVYSKRMKRVDRLNTYYIPLRNAERKALHNALIEYNTNGDIEEDIIFNDGSRNGMYGGGYWD